MKNIKIPEKQYGKSAKYAFRELSKHGDVIHIKTDKPNLVRDAAYKFAKYHGISLTTRADENGVNVYFIGGNHDT